MIGFLIMKKRCVFFLTSLSQGGAETYLLRFLDYSKGRNHSTVWCTSGAGGDLLGEYKKCADELVFKRLGYFSLGGYIYLYYWFKKNKPGTVCDFAGNFAGIVMLVAYLAGVKNRIAQYRGASNHFKETKGRLLYNAIVNRLVYHFATKILSNSEAAFDFFFPSHKDSKKYFKVIPNGIPDEYFIIDSDSRKRKRAELGIPDGAFVVGHTGRYNYAKNHETIIKVAKELCGKYDDIYFVLAGKGTDVELRRTVDNAGLSDKVKLLGYRRDVKELLTALDLYYFPSVTESQPNALQEAMARGVPVLASDIAPIKECVPPDFRQKLVSPKDVKNAVKVISCLHDDRTLLKEYKLRRWTQERFSAVECFKMFQSEL